MKRCIRVWWCPSSSPRARYEDQKLLCLLLLLFLITPIMELTDFGIQGEYETSKYIYKGLYTPISKWHKPGVI